MSFALVRHESLPPAGLDRAAGTVGRRRIRVWRPARSHSNGRIDYTAEPSVVYSLYMHLGGADQFDFDLPVEANPGWLNRVLVRKKECDPGKSTRRAICIRHCGRCLPPTSRHRHRLAGRRRPTCCGSTKIG